MAFAVIDKLLTNARTKLPGALDQFILMELFNAVNEFCRRSDANRFAAPIALVENQNTYTVTFANEVVIRMFEIAHEKMDVSNTYYDPDDGILSLTRLPSATDVAFPLYLNVSLAPKPGSLTPDNWMPELNWTRYYDVLLDGVLFMMMGQMAKPYTNLVLSRYHGQRFRNGMNKAKTLASVGNAPDARSWRFPPT